MAFLGDLIVKIGANANPFTAGLKKAQSMTQTFRNSLKDMEKTASTFAKLAASIKAVNNQMDRLVNVSKRALAAANIQADAENRRFKIRMEQLRAVRRLEETPKSSSRSMMEIAGGIGIARGIEGAVSGLASMAISTVSLAADAEVMRGEFSVLLGDVGKGAKMFADLEKFAMRTSFNLESAADAARVMMASGIKEGDLIGTMQLLGDLSMGDANRLALLSKAYTDVFNKQKLQAQEVKQFAENGIGVLAALGAELKKKPAEVSEMITAGEVSFDMLQSALISLTAEGGRFYNAMDTRNKTLRGQWDSLKEGIEKTGRAIGDAMLPQLKIVGTEINGMLGKFNDMPDKLEFASKFLKTGFVLAIETIAVKWESMLKRITEKTLNAFGAMLDGISSGKIDEAMKGVAGLFPEGGSPKALQKAQRDFDALLKQLKPDAAGAAAAAAAPPALQKKVPVDGSKITGALGGLFDALKPIGAGIEQYIGTKLTEGKMAIGQWQGIFGRIFDGEKVKKPEVAGAMLKGSQEAYSTIVASMLKSADPTVKAIQTQTKELVKKLKPKDPQQMVAMGAVN